MTITTLPCAYRGAVHVDVTLDRHVIVGRGSVIVPRGRIGIRVAAGSLSLVRTDCCDFTMCARTPALENGSEGPTLLPLGIALQEEAARAGSGGATESFR